MINSIYTISQIADILSPLFERYRVKRAILFGSYANGSAGLKSDVDLCVDSNLRGLDFMLLVDDVNTALNKDVDMFDVTHVKRNSLIDREINETGVVIYEK
jgi:predicted nucleotidyltransferase